MGIGDALRKFVTGESKAEQEAAEESSAPVHGEQTCALCNKPGAEKKWGGAYWHKKCARMARNQARKMI